MENFTALIGHLAWPATVTILGLVFIRELKRGLLDQIMPNGGTFEAGASGFKFQTNSARQSVRNANVQVLDEIKVEPDPDLTPYDQVMDSWRELAAALTATAVSLGGVDDKRKIMQNLRLLRESAVYDSDVLDGVRKLFQARNSARKLGPGSLAEDDAAIFVGTANALTKVFNA